MKIQKMIQFGITLFAICAVCILPGKKALARTSTTKVLPTDMTTASKGNVLMGLEGSFANDVQNAVNRVNAIRKEACQNGYPDPRDCSRKLTMDDYVPIKWSSDLEFIARIRAAEASIYPQHERPTGASCFDIAGPNGVTSYAEVLAWGADTITGSVNMWYTEKSIWVKQGQGVTGHYTNMINPDTTYMGMANFDGTGAGEFTNEDWVAFDFADGTAIKIDTTPLSSAKNIIQTVEVPSDSLSKAKIVAMPGYTKKTSLSKNATVQYNLVRTYNSYMELQVLGDISWSSSNSSAVSVNQSGKAKASGYGKAVIKAVSSSGVSASVSVQVPVKVTATSITKITAGKKKLTITCKKKTVDGYEVQCSTKKNFKSGVKKKIVAGKGKTKITITKLKAKKKYYVRVRSYKLINGKKYYSSWSKVKTRKTS